MKKVLGIAVAVMMLASVVAKAGVSDVSLRMDGLNSSLVGITADEYSDFMAVNTANILNVEGQRLYTNLSRLGTGNEFLLGGVTPFGMGKMGGFFGMNNEKLDDDIRVLNHVSYSGSAGYDATDGVNDDNLGPWPNLLQGEYDYEDIDDRPAGGRRTTITTAEAYDTPSDMNLNLLGGFDTMIDLGDLGLRIGYAKDVITDISGESSWSYEDESVANSKITGDLEWTDEEYESTISIEPSIGGLSLMGMDLGVSVEYAMVNMVDNDEADGTYLEEEGNHPGDSDYERTYHDETIEELSGSRMGLKADGSYPLNDSVNVKGLVGFYSGKVDGDNESETVNEVTKDGGAGLAILIGDEKETVSQTIAREEKMSTIMGRVGIDKSVSNDLLLGAGIRMSRTTTESISNEDRAVQDKDGAKSYAITTTDETTETSNTVISLPIGLEWTANSWLEARLGATYAITSSKSKNTTVDYNYDGTTAGANVDREEETVSSQPVSVSDAVTYYAGLGIAATENLDIDFVNLGGGNLDLSNWKFGATLKF